jgi:hypothetical protein
MGLLAPMARHLARFTANTGIAHKFIEEDLKNGKPFRFLKGSSIN